jgi:hypothetical protein
MKVEYYCTYCPGCTTEGNPCGQHTAVSVVQASPLHQIVAPSFYSGGQSSGPEYSGCPLPRGTVSGTRPPQVCLPAAAALLRPPYSGLQQEGQHGAPPIAQPPAQLPTRPPSIPEGAVTRERKSRRRWKPNELDILQSAFARCPFPNTMERRDLAARMNATPRAIQIWLQNARARAKSECCQCSFFFRSYKRGCGICRA